MVIAMVENKNELIPVRAEPESNVSNTLIPTLPHKMVVNKKFESPLNASIFVASLFPLLDSTSSWSLLNEKKAKFSPEKIADCEIQKIMPSQRNKSIKNYSPILK